MKNQKKDVLEGIKEKVSTYESALANANAACDTAQAKVAAAEKAMNAAADANDSVAFAAAKQNLAEAKTDLEMMQLRISRLKAKGAVSESETDAAVAFFLSELKKIDTAAATQIVKHFDEIGRIVESAKEDSTATYRQFVQAASLLGRELPTSIRTGNISRVVQIMSKPMKVTGALVGSGGTRELYILAGRKV